jgi:hypothetical protein
MSQQPWRLSWSAYTYGRDYTHRVAHTVYEYREKSSDHYPIGVEILQMYGVF